MFSRIKNALSQSQVLSALRFSRGIAGATGGVFFTIGGIFTAPLKKFLYGFGPAGTTLVVSLIALATRMKNNYKAAHPDEATVQFKKQQKELSTKLMIDVLRQDPDKTHQFLTQIKLPSADITRIETWMREESIDVEDILKKIYKAVEFDITKYPASFAFALMTSGAHYIELLLLQVNVDPEMVNFNLALDQGFTLANGLIGGITLIALIQGILEFVSVKQSYENVDDVTMHAEILRKLSAFKPAAAAEASESDRLNINDNSGYKTLSTSS